MASSGRERRRTLLCALAWLVVLAAPRLAFSETGHDLWLRYAPAEDAALRTAYRRSASSIVVPGQSATREIIAAELKRGLHGLLGADVAVSASVRTPGAILVGTPATSPEIAGLKWSAVLQRLGDGGYVIRSAHDRRPRGHRRRLVSQKSARSTARSTSCA